MEDNANRDRHKKSKELFDKFLNSGDAKKFINEFDKLYPNESNTESQEERDRFYYKEAGSKCEIHDRERVWGLAYGEESAKKICEGLNAISRKSSESKVMENQEEQIAKAIDDYSFQVPYDGTNKFYNEEKAKHFEAGVRWAISTKSTRPESEVDKLIRYNNHADALLESYAREINELKEKITRPDERDELIQKLCNALEAYTDFEQSPIRLGMVKLLIERARKLKVISGVGSR